jgi:hypothetical protein
MSIAKKVKTIKNKYQTALYKTGKIKAQTNNATIPIRM